MWDSASQGQRACLFILAFFVWSIAVAMVPQSWLSAFWPGLILLGCLLRPHPMRFMFRWMGVGLVVLVMSLGILWFRSGEEAQLQFQATLQRGLLASGFAVMVASAFSSTALLQGLSVLRLPGPFLVTVTMMLRFLEHFESERRDLLRARQARQFGNPRWNANAQVLAELLLRSLDRSHKVYQALKARGWRAVDAHQHTD